MSTYVVSSVQLCDEGCCLRTFDSELLYPNHTWTTDITAQVSRPMYQVIPDNYDRSDGTDMVLYEFGEPVEDFDFERPVPGDWHLRDRRWEQLKAVQRQNGWIPMGETELVTV